MRIAPIFLTLLLLTAADHRVRSQEPPPASADTTIRVVLLGTAGGPTFNAQRLGISTLVEAAVSKAGYSLRSETAPVEKTSALRENLPIITLVIMMALSWGLEQFNHPFGNLAFIATTLVGTARPQNIRNNIAYVNEPMDEQLLAEVLEILAPIHNHNFTRGLPEHRDPILA